MGEAEAYALNKEISKEEIDVQSMNHENAQKLLEHEPHLMHVAQHTRNETPKQGAQRDKEKLGGQAGMIFSID